MDINERKNHIVERQRPWYLTNIDLMRSCKTGEVIEAPAESLGRRLKIIGFGLMVGGPLIIASLWFFKTWVPGHYDRLNELAQSDPVASMRKVAEFTSLLLFAAVLTGLILGVCATIAGVRVLRAGRWPLPGAKVRRRTEVVAGWWCVRLPAAMVLMLLWACLLVSWVCYVNLLSLFWNRVLDEQVGMAGKTPSARRTDSKLHSEFSIPKKA